jgi:hypothetical protein
MNAPVGLTKRCSQPLENQSAPVVQASSRAYWFNLDTLLRRSLSSKNLGSPGTDDANIFNRAAVRCRLIV